MEDRLKQKTASGLLWNGVERTASRGIQFVFSILIARILIPSDYGLIAIVNLLISLSDILIDSGLSKALLRKKDKEESDYNVLFFFNVSASILIYLLFLIAAPLFAIYYQEPTLTPLIRWGTLALVINAIGSTQSLLLVASMDFRKKAVLEIVAILISGPAALFLASKGYGVWALLWQGLTACIIRSFLLWIIVHWIPSKDFSWQSFRQLFSFGSHLLISEYIQRIYSAVNTLTIGKVFSPAQLGLYGKADAFTSVPSSLIAGPMSSVSYPSLSQIQDDEEQLVRVFYSMTSLSLFAILPVMLGLAAISPVMVPVILTEKWCGMIPILKILALSYVFLTMATIPQNYILIKGGSKIILYIQLFTKGIGLILLFWFSHYSIIAVCWAYTTVTFLFTILAFYYTKKQIHFSTRELIKSYLPTILLSLGMAAIVSVNLLIIKNQLISMIVGILAGALFYCLMAELLHNQQWQTLKSMLIPYFHK